MANWPGWPIGHPVKLPFFNSSQLARRLHSNRRRYAGRVLRIQRSESSEAHFTLSGQMDQEAMAELETMISAETSVRRIVLNLKDLLLVDEEVVIFLERCESAGITLENCPPYIREWINRQRQGS